VSTAAKAARRARSSGVSMEKDAGAWSAGLPLRRSNSHRRGGGPAEFAAGDVRAVADRGPLLAGQEAAVVQAPSSGVVDWCRVRVEVLGQPGQGGDDGGPSGMVLQAVEQEGGLGRGCHGAEAGGGLADVEAGAEGDERLGQGAGQDLGCLVAVSWRREPDGPGWPEQRGDLAGAAGGGDRAGPPGAWVAEGCELDGLQDGAGPAAPRACAGQGG
jgi:hypothetical protein